MGEDSVRGIECLGVEEGEEMVEEELKLEGVRLKAESDLLKMILGEEEGEEIGEDRTASLR